MSNPLPRFPVRVTSLLGAVTLAVLLVAGSNFASAQSATRSSRGSTRAPAQYDSTSKSGSASASVALQGYCPVCIIKMKKWVKGNPNIQATYDGKTYYFPSSEQKGMFLSDPAKYVPALGGDCTVCLAKMGERVPGTVHHAALARVSVGPNVVGAQRVGGDQNNVGQRA